MIDVYVYSGLQHGCLRDAGNEGLYHVKSFDPKTNTNWQKDVEAVVQIIKRCSVCISGGDALRIIIDYGDLQ